MAFEGRQMLLERQRYFVGLGLRLGLEIGGRLVVRFRARVSLGLGLVRVGVRVRLGLTLRLRWGYA